jgi:uncharacterized protein YigE (DUF2233 family)
MRTLFAIFAVGVAVAVVWLVWPRPRVAVGPRDGWRPAARGTELREFAIRGVNGAVGVTAVRIDPRCRIRVVDAHRGIRDGGAQVSDVCPAGGAAINANFFDESLNPIGLVLTDGRTVSKTTFPKSLLKPWGHFLIVNGMPAIRPVARRLPAGSTQGVQCGPMLVMGGVLNTFPDLPTAPRAGVGIDAIGRVLFAICDRSVTMAQWAACLRDDLGCVDALNLDGGPSAQLAVTGTETLRRDGAMAPVFLVAEPISD